jgi:hypothetical protein
MYFELVMPVCNGTVICDDMDVTSYVQDELDHMEPGQELVIRATALTDDEVAAMPEFQGC